MLMKAWDASHKGTLSKGGGQGELDWPPASRNRQSSGPSLASECPCGQAWRLGSNLTFPCFFGLYLRKNALLATEAPIPSMLLAAIGPSRRLYASSGHPLACRGSGSVIP